MHCLQWLAVEADTLDEAHDILFKALSAMEYNGQRYLDFQTDQLAASKEPDYDEADWEFDGDDPEWFTGFILGAPRFIPTDVENEWTHTGANTIPGTDLKTIAGIVNRILVERPSNYEDYWDENSRFWDFYSETSLVEEFIERVEEDPERQFLIPVDFKV